MPAQVHHEELLRAAPAVARPVEAARAEPERARVVDELLLPARGGRTIICVVVLHSQLLGCPNRDAPYVYTRIMGRGRMAGRPSSAVAAAATRSPGCAPRPAPARAPATVYPFMYNSLPFCVPTRARAPPAAALRPAARRAGRAAGSSAAGPPGGAPQKPSAIPVRMRYKRTRMRLHVGITIVKIKGCIKKQNMRCEMAS